MLCHRKVMNTRKDNAKRLHPDLTFQWCDGKQTIFGDIFLVNKWIAVMILLFQNQSWFEGLHVMKGFWTTKPGFWGEGVFLLLVKKKIIILGMVTIGLAQALEDLAITGWVGTIQITALLSPVRILRRVQETWGDSLSLKLLWETIS